MQVCGNATCGGPRNERIYASRQQDQRDRGGRRLDVQNAAADGPGAINTGRYHAEQKEDFDLQRNAGDALQQAPDQPGGQKAVVEPLIGGEHRGIRSPFPA